MKVLIDMNLSPDWVHALQKTGIEAKHWSEVGDPRAKDLTIMEWAQAHGYIVFTHDLDFGTILAATKRIGPSVIQVRTQDVSPAHLEHQLVLALSQFKAALLGGALLVIDEDKTRVRILPFELDKES